MSCKTSYLFKGNVICQAPTEDRWLTFSLTFFKVIDFINLDYIHSASFYLHTSDCAPITYELIRRTREPFQNLILKITQLKTPYKNQLVRWLARL